MVNMLSDSAVGNVTIHGFSFGFVYILLVLLCLETLLLLYWLYQQAGTHRFDFFHRLANEQREVERLTHKNMQLQSRLLEDAETNNRRLNYMNSVFAAMDDGILAFNMQKHIVLLNPEAQKLLEIDNTIFFHQSQAQQKEPLRSIMTLCAEIITYEQHLERQIEVADGVYYDVTLSQIPDRYQREVSIGVLVHIRDVSKIKHLEIQRKEFVANVSHEFRTPMTLISGFAEMLRTQSNVPEKDYQRALEIIDIETERLKKLISELLTLSEIEGNLNTQNTSTIDVQAVVRQILTSHQVLADQKGIVLDCVVENTLPKLQGNARFFYQAIANVMENAIKYTQPKGYIKIHVYLQSGSICICISDNGEGIPQADIDYIFERFYRVEKARSSQTGGSGIGLAIVKNIVSVFGGDIQVESTLHAGSAFTLRFPVCGNNHQDIVIKEE